MQEQIVYDYGQAAWTEFTVVLELSYLYLHFAHNSLH